MLVTYLIATHNRKDILKRHLDLLVDQHWPEWFEVIVCDDGSTDGTQELLAGLKNNWHYTIQHTETGNTDKACVAQSRNKGIRAARGEIIIMADDDCLPHPRLIEQYVKNFKPREVQCGYRSNLEAYLSLAIPVPLEEDSGTMKTWTEAWKAGNFGYFSTNSCCMAASVARTQAKDGSLGFDERFVGYGHEDSEFGRRLSTMGYKLVFNADAVTWHVNPGLTPQQDSTWKEKERAKSSKLMKQILAEPYPVYPGYCNITGMMSEKELRWLWQMSESMASVVELGSWQGRSTHALCSGCPGLVYSVDHWDPEYIGIPGLSEQIINNNRKAFFSNVGHFNNLKVVMLPSLKAVGAFRDGTVDMVFIDADHAYGSVMADIAAWLPKTVKIVSGHDYEIKQHPGVVKAVDEVFGPVGHVDTIWFKELK